MAFNNKLLVFIAGFAAVVVAMFLFGHSASDSVETIEADDANHLADGRNEDRLEDLRESTDHRAMTPATAAEGEFSRPQAVEAGLFDQFRNVLELARSGDVDEQFTLSEVLASCARFNSLSKEPASDRHMARFQSACAELVSANGELRSGDLHEIALEWEERSIAGGSVRPRAMKVLEGIEKDDEQSIADAQQALREMLPSADPYVYFAISATKDNRQGANKSPSSESVAWRILACEDSQLFICGSTNQEMAMLCRSAIPCEGMTAEEFYYHLYPEVLDEARAHLMILREQLAAKAFDDIDLSFEYVE